jgi:hypothetical protein
VEGEPAQEAQQEHGRGAREDAAVSGGRPAAALEAREGALDVLVAEPRRAALEEAAQVVVEDRICHGFPPR